MTKSRDVQESRLRFGCGATAGLFLGLLLFGLVNLNYWVVGGLVMICAVSIGCLAVRYGDPLWYRLEKCLEWFCLWWP